MKLKNVLLTVGLSLGVGATAIGFTMLNSQPTIESKAAIGDAWYVRGTMNGWSVDADDETYKIVEGTTPLVLDIESGNNFKVVNHASSWSGVTELTTALGNASGHGITFTSGSDAYVNQTGKYRFSVDGGALKVEVAWVYNGSDTTKTGAASGWAAASSYYLWDGGASATWNMKEGEEFKLTNGINSWGEEYGYDLSGTASSNTLTGSNGSNTYCKHAGDYKFLLSNGTLYVDFVDGTEFYYKGSDASKAGTEWTAWTGHPITVNGSAVEFSLAKDETFGLVSPGGEWFGAGCLADDKYYHCFGVDGDNIKMNLTYSRFTLAVTIVNHVLTIVPSAVGQTYKTNYVLDLNGNLLSSNPRAHAWHGAAGDDYPPGLEMTNVAGASNIYEVTYWDVFDSLIFGNDETNTINFSSPVNGECLVLSWDYTDGVWTSNCWVSLDAAKYIANYLKFADDGAHQNNEGSGLCKTDGWYDDAQKAYAKLDDDVKKDVCSSSYALGRLQAWAAANEESFIVTDGIGAFEASRTVNGFLTTVGSDSNSSLIAVIAITALATAAGMFFLFRRKEQ